MSIGFYGFTFLGIDFYISLKNGLGDQLGRRKERPARRIAVAGRDVGDRGLGAPGEGQSLLLPDRAEVERRGAVVPGDLDSVGFLLTVRPGAGRPPEVPGSRGAATARSPRVPWPGSAVPPPRWRRWRRSCGRCRRRSSGSGTEPRDRTRPGPAGAWCCRSRRRRRGRWAGAASRCRPRVRPSRRTRSARRGPGAASPRVGGLRGELVPAAVSWSGPDSARRGRTAARRWDGGSWRRSRPGRR